jgi:hypothetical protein
MVFLEHIWGPIIELVLRWVEKFVPPQAKLDAQARSLRIAVLEGQAVSGASDEAAERQRAARQDLSLAMQIHDIDMQYIREEQESAQRDFATDAAKPLPGKIPFWRFLRRWAASREMEERAARIAALNETINDCGTSLQSSAKTCAEMTRLLHHSNETPANTPSSEPDAASRARAPGRVPSQ